jgi:hypothetical protein
VGHEKVARHPFLHCESLWYIGYTSTWLHVYSCVLIQEATTFSIYDGISFQHLAAVLISVFMQCYGPGLLFRRPFCIYSIYKIHTHTHARARARTQVYVSVAPDNFFLSCPVTVALGVLQAVCADSLQPVTLQVNVFRAWLEVPAGVTFIWSDGKTCPI